MLLPSSPLDEPESRREFFLEAVRSWDRSMMNDAVVYACRLFKWHEHQTLLVMHNLFFWLKNEGYRFDTLPHNTLLLFWEVLLERPPLTRRPIKKDRTLYSWWRGFRRLLEIMEWGGLEPGPLELPPKPQYARIRPALSEREFQRLLDGARRHPDGRLRSLGVASLYLLGETGVWPKELFNLRLEDYAPPQLRIRGARARQIPLSLAARQALEGYLYDREGVSSQLPVASPYLFLRMTEKRGGLGKPFNLDALRSLLKRISQMAEVHPERIIGGLRWRAVRYYLQAGLTPAEVAERTGLSSVAELRES